MDIKFSDSAIEELKHDIADFNQITNLDDKILKHDEIKKKTDALKLKLDRLEDMLDEANEHMDAIDSDDGKEADIESEKDLYTAIKNIEADVSHMKTERDICEQINMYKNIVATIAKCHRFCNAQKMKTFTCKN